jgi:hypothetical protein
MQDSTPLPLPSKLFHVVPVGLDTGQIESLTGYIARLAQAHMITPLTLLHRGLEWFDTDQPERVGEWKRKTTRLLLRRYINAPGTGERWVRLLTDLTRAPGLSSCTMRAFGSLFPVRGQLRSHLAWCPSCFAEDTEPYDRLLWCLPQVKACVRHRCRLVERCPGCGSRVPVIHARSVPGLCPSCETKLSRKGTTTQIAAVEEWGIAKLADDFLQLASGHPHIEQIRQVEAGTVLKKCMAAAGVPDAAALARLMNVSRITGWSWLNGRSVPGFGETLRICYTFKVSVADFLTAEIPVKLTLRGTGELALRPARRAPREFDEPKVARSIEQYCSECINRPPSIVEVASAVGFDPRVLRRHFPAACRDTSPRN